MKTALFISGRLTCYEENLINVLNTTFCENDIDLFISINGVRDEYHIEAEEKLSKWLRKIDYEEYNVPDDFINTHPESLRQTVNNKNVSYTVMSMFYNDKKNFLNIENYAKENNIQYDIVCKFRPDIYFINPFFRILFNAFINNKDTLFCCTPPCQIILYGDKHPEGPLCINDAFSLGSMEVMKRYCSTYDRIFLLNEKYNGNFRLNYEVSLTECFWGEESFPKYTNDILQRLHNANNNCPYKIVFFNLQYDINNKRTLRDKIKRDNSHTNI